MVQECLQEGRPALGAGGLAADFAADVVDVIGGEVGQASVLQITPKLFLGIEFWGVGRKPDDVPLRVGGQVVTNHLVLVGIPSVPEQYDRACVVTAEMAKKGQHLGTTHVTVGVQLKKERH